MKIRCIANTGNALPESYLKPEFYFTKEVEFPLTLGKEYVVYALYQSQGNGKDSGQKKLQWRHLVK
jgi:hypothetical protein